MFLKFPNKMQLVNDIVRIQNFDITSLVPLQIRGHELKHFTIPAPYPIDLCHSLCERSY